MIAKRRARKRSLIRSNIMNAALTKTLSSMEDASTIQTGSFASHVTPLSSYSRPVLQSNLTNYLHQLSTLHAAGILTDEEFSAARTRLFGS